MLEVKYREVKSLVNSLYEMGHRGHVQDFASFWRLVYRAERVEKYYRLRNTR